MAAARVRRTPPDPWRAPRPTRRRASSNVGTPYAQLAASGPGLIATSRCASQVPCSSTACSSQVVAPALVQAHVVAAVLHAELPSLHGAPQPALRTRGCRRRPSPPHEPRHAVDLRPARARAPCRRARFASARRPSGAQCSGSARRSPLTHLLLVRLRDQVGTNELHHCSCCGELVPPAPPLAVVASRIVASPCATATATKFRSDGSTSSVKSSSNESSSGVIATRTQVSVRHWLSWIHFAN